MLRKLILLVLVAGLAPVAAQAAGLKTGPRFGLSLSPDQLVLGGQLIVPNVAPKMSLVPNLELGFGDDLTVIAMNADLRYHFAVQGTDWSPYAGLGIGINSIQIDRPAPFRDDSDTEVGLNVIAGMGVPIGGGSEFFTEARIGAGDIPDLKIMAGWNFRMR